MNLQEFYKSNNWTFEEIKEFELSEEKQDTELRLLLKQYDKDHECCPKCCDIHEFHNRVPSKD